NTATGAGALLSNIIGVGNTAMGAFALFNNITGGNNTAIGARALEANTTGTFNIALGQGAASSVTTANNVICIGTLLPGANVDNSCYVGNIFGQMAASGMPVVINADSKLGTTTSSKRFKEEIRPMDRVSEALFSLKPI